MGFEPVLEDALVGDWEREGERQPTRRAVERRNPDGTRPGSLRKIHAAAKSCVTARSSAALANQA
jgi:hypothetical protein